MADQVLDPSEVFQTIYAGVLRKDPSAVHKIQNGDDKAIVSVLRMFKLDPSNENKDMLKSLAYMFPTEDEEATTAANAQAKSKQTSDQFKKDFSKAVDTIMTVDPRYRAIKTGATIASNLARAGGQAAENNANALAQALLSRRHHSDAQDNIYGQNYLDRSAQATAAKTAADGANANAVLSAFSNTINSLLGAEDLNQQQRMQTKMAPYMADIGLSGQGWQMLGQREKRAYSQYKQ